MLLDGMLERARSRHEKLMLDTIRIERPGDPVTAPDGTVTRTPVVLYTGKAFVDAANRAEQEREAGEREVVLRDYNVLLPFSAITTEPVKIGHTIVVTDSSNPRLIDKRLTVTADAQSSIDTAWIIPAELQT